MGIYIKYMITYTANGSLIKNKVIEGMAGNELEMDGHLSVSGTIKANQFMTVDGKTISLEDTHKKIKEIKDTHVTLDAHNVLKDTLLKADEGLAKKSDLESLQQEVTQLKNSNVSNEEVKELRTKLDNVKNSNLGPRQIVGTGNEKLVIGNMGYKNWSGIGNAKLNGDPNKLIEVTSGLGGKKGTMLTESECKKYAESSNYGYGMNNNNPKGCIKTGNQVRFSTGNRECSKVNSCIEKETSSKFKNNYALIQHNDGTTSINSSQGRAVQFRQDDSIKMTIAHNGHVGIGTDKPDTKNGWDKVLEVQGGPHAKTLVTTKKNGVKMGTYAHQNWGGPSGSVGTESNHDLRLLTNYNEKMRIKANGHVGVGTSNPQEKLDVNGTIKIHGSNGKFSAYGDNSRVASKKEYIEFVKTDNSTDGARLYAEGSANQGKLVLGITDDLQKQEAFIIRGEYHQGAAKNIAEFTGDSNVFTNNITFKNNGTNWWHRRGGDAAIVNANNYNTLMIVGRGEGRRRIGMWDDITVNGRFYNKSDAKLKKDIKKMNSKEELNKIKKISGFNYKRKDIKDNSINTGLIAQDIE